VKDECFLIKMKLQSNADNIKKYVLITLLSVIVLWLGLLFLWPEKDGKEFNEIINANDFFKEFEKNPKVLKVYENGTLIIEGFFSHIDKNRGGLVLTDSSGKHYLYYTIPFHNFDITHLTKGDTLVMKGTLQGLRYEDGSELFDRIDLIFENNAVINHRRQKND
jgi:hypothetical protein